MPFSTNPSTSIISSLDPLGRRKVLGTLGLTSLGIAASAITAHAATPRVSISTNERRKPTIAAVASVTQSEGRASVPQEWIAMNGATVNEYYKYLSTLKMQRVSPRQVIEAHAKNKSGVWNSVPPKTWWKRMGYVLRVVDRIALEMNVSQVEIVSAYRNPSYNAQCAGAKANSWHQANVAADVKFPVKASDVTKTARHLRDLGLFKGGVGGYWNFTHIDARGENINW